MQLWSARLVSLGGAPVAQEMWRQALFSHLSSDSWHPTQLIFNSPGPSAVGGRTAAHASRNAFSHVFRPASPGRRCSRAPPWKVFFVGLGVGVAAVYQPSRAGPTGGTPRELPPIWELAFLTCHVRMGHGSRTSAICEVAPGGPREPPGRREGSTNPLEPGPLGWGVK